MPTKQPINRPTLRVLLNLRKIGWSCSIFSEIWCLPKCWHVFYYSVTLSASWHPLMISYLPQWWVSTHWTTLSCDVNEGIHGHANPKWRHRAILDVWSLNLVIKSVFYFSSKKIWKDFEILKKHFPFNHVISTATFICFRVFVLLLKL